MAGRVYLVGAGPGDPGLITVRGLACLSRAELVVADHLVNPALLDAAPATAELIVRPERRTGPYGAQEELNRLLVERGLAGQIVVRLKGGDPFVFGRGGEEAEALAQAGVPFEVVPGVTAAIAAPAYAGIPVTHRGRSGVVAFATGHEAEDPPRPGSQVDWDAVARGAGTLVLYMSVNRLGDVVRRLLAAGRSPDEPVAVVERGTLPGQRTLEATLGTIVDEAARAEIRPPALTIVGEVVRERAQIGWFETRPLHGRSILLLATRAAELDGVEVDGAELVTASPLQVVPRFSQVKQALARIDRFRTVALASAHAADAVVSALGSLGHDARALAGIKLAAIGEATQRRMAELHLLADLVAKKGGAELAAEIVSSGLSGPVLIAHAAGGREDLADGLRASGVEVETVEAYETVADSAALGRVARRHRQRPFDAIGFASPKGARAFLEVLGANRLLDGVLLGAIGETTRAALAESGLACDVVPERPELSQLLAGLVLAARSKFE